MSISKLGAEQPKLNLQLPLRFDSGTYTGSIVDAWNVTLALNVHANIGPELIRGCNSFASLSAQNEKLVEALRDSHHRVRFLIQDYASDIDTAPIEAELVRWDALLAQSRGEQS